VDNSSFSKSFQSSLSVRDMAWGFVLGPCSFFTIECIYNLSSRTSLNMIKIQAARNDKTLLSITGSNLVERWLSICSRMTIAISGPIRVGVGKGRPYSSMPSRPVQTANRTFWRLKEIR
jgi:hypothetical protein